MRNPEYVLNSLAMKSSDSNYQFQRIYRNLYNPRFYDLAYQKLVNRFPEKRHPNLFPGQIKSLIQELKNETYQPESLLGFKKKGRLRDSLVAIIVRMLLEAMYEGAFSSLSHGYRSRRSSHTALWQVKQNFSGVKWMVHGTLHSFFPAISFEVLRSILRKRISDAKFIRLINKFLRAGWMEDWQFRRTYSGNPVGGWISPVLVNIYFHELDQYVEGLISGFCQGKKRRKNPDYESLLFQIKQLEKRMCQMKNGSEKEKLLRQKQYLYKRLENTPVEDPWDPSYKRLAYVRYAGEILLGVIGSKKESFRIRDQVAAFLQQELNIPLSREQMALNHAKKHTRFLGYDITVNEQCKLILPKDIWIKRLHRFGAVKEQNGNLKPVHKKELVQLSDAEILHVYNRETMRLYNYYRLAENVSNLSRFSHLMKYSMYKTLAMKYKSSVRKILRKYMHEGRFLVPAETGDRKKAFITFYDRGFQCNHHPIKESCLDLMNPSAKSLDKGKT